MLHQYRALFPPLSLLHFCCALAWATAITDKEGEKLVQPWWCYSGCRQGWGAVLLFAKVLRVLRDASFALLPESPVGMLLPLWETKWPLSKENLAAIAGPTVLLGYFGEGREYPESRASWCGSCVFHNSLLAPQLCHVKGSPHLISAQLSAHLLGLWHQALSPVYAPLATGGMDNLPKEGGRGDVSGPERGNKYLDSDSQKITWCFTSGCHQDVLSSL